MSLQKTYLEALEKFMRSEKLAANTLELLNTHEALAKNLAPGDVENLVIAAHYRAQIPEPFCGIHVGFYLKDWMGKEYHITDAAERLSSQRVVKEFSMNDTLPWLSWQEFGDHKNVTSWVITDSGHAVGFNENVSVGYSYVVKKLSKEQLDLCMIHWFNYSQYNKIEEIPV